MRISETTGFIVTAIEPRNVDVTIIRAGTSANGYTYPERVLEQAAPLFEGATAFCDHSLSHRSVRDVIGSYSRPAYMGGAIKAVLRLIDGQIAALVEHILADRTANVPTPDVGLSVDISADIAPDRTVTSITAVHSVDLVFQPSAGGTLDRLIEHIQQETSPMPAPTTTPVGAACACPPPAATPVGAACACPPCVSS